MPRVTRRSLNEEEVPSRSSPRAATKASSAASASPARGRSRKSLRGEEAKAVEKSQESVEKRGRGKSANQEKEKTTRQSRSRRRQAEEEEEEKVTSPSPVKRGRTQRDTPPSAEFVLGRKSRQQEEPEEEGEKEEETVTPNAKKGRSQGGGQASKGRGASASQRKSPAPTPATTTSTRASRSRRSAGAPDEEPLGETEVESKNKVTPKGRGRGRQVSSTRSRGRGREKAKEAQDDEVEGVSESKEAAAEEYEESSKECKESTADEEAMQIDCKTEAAEEEAKVPNASADKSSEHEESSETENLVEPAPAKSGALSGKVEPMEHETADAAPQCESLQNSQNGEITIKRPPSSGTKRKLDEKEEAIEDMKGKNEGLTAKRPRLNGNDSDAAAAQDDQKANMVDVSEAEKQDLLKDFVVVNAEDVPASDSAEVAEAVPQTVTKPSSAAPVMEVMEVENAAASTIGDVTVLPLTEAEVAKAYAAETKEQEIDEVSSLAVEVGSIASSDVTSCLGRSLDTSEQQSSSNSIDGDEADVNIAEGDSNVDGGDSAASVSAQPPQTASDASQPDSIPDAQAQSSSQKTSDIASLGDGINAAGAADTGICEAKSKPDDKIRTAKTPSSVSQSLGTPDPTFLATYSSPSILNRAYVQNPAVPADSVDPAKTFSVINYNILAECHRQRSDYSYTPDEFLRQEYRHGLMMNEIKHLNGDVVCLQEVNPAYYENTLLPEMKRLGFEGIIIRRTKDFYDEGAATFYKTDRFELESSKGVSLTEVAFKEVELGGLSPEVGAAVREYLDRSDVVLVTRLRCKVTGKLVTIGNIHVVWDNLQSPDVQCIQAACGIKEVVSMAGGEGSPHIICGDFNAEWNSPLYQLVVDSYLSDSSIQALQAVEKLHLKEGSKSLVNHLWRAFQHTSSNLRSAYSTVTGSEPEVTTYTDKPLTVDYLFFNASSLVPVGVLKTVDRAAVEVTGGLPARDFPSDHLSLKTILAFTD